MDFVHTTSDDDDCEDLRTFLTSLHPENAECKPHVPHWASHFKVDCSWCSWTGPLGDKWAHDRFHRTP